MELSPSDLQEILGVFVDSDLRELHIEVGNVKLRVSKERSSPIPDSSTSPSRTSQLAPAATPTPSVSPAPPGAVPPAAAAPERDTAGLVAVTSPVVGVFYRRSAPDQPSYVEVGDTVDPQTPVCTIEVMKMFTEVTAGCAGTVVEICVDNEQLVEHGQVLLYVEPTADAT